MRSPLKQNKSQDQNTPTYVRKQNAHLQAQKNSNNAISATASVSSQSSGGERINYRPANKTKTDSAAEKAALLRAQKVLDNWDDEEDSSAVSVSVW